MKSIAPNIWEKAFNCPFCHTFTQQFLHCVGVDNFYHERDRQAVVYNILGRAISSNGNQKEAKGTSPDPIARPQVMLESLGGRQVKNVHITECFNCQNLIVWIGTVAVWPVFGQYPQPHPDLPADLRKDYEEAGSIVQKSPRGAAALLRLVVQKLCIELGGLGKDINADIGALVSKGLDVRVQKMLDSVRVVGNEAVHPGTMDIADDQEIALELFGLINLIVEAMISQPKRIDDFYNSLPASKLSGIEQRDGKKGTESERPAEKPPEN